MNLTSGDISALVFKPIVREDLGNFSLDGHMLTLLMALDGKLALGQVSQKTGLNMADLRDAASKLVALKLIESVAKATNYIDHEFFQSLVSELSIALGPLAQVILEDGLEDLGLTQKTFPTHRAAELINLLAQEIQREEKRTAFKQSMVKLIKLKGY
jgi:hypothetical protein